MSTFTTFEEIEAWKESRILNKKIREICKRENVARDFSFIDQIKRSCRSISVNIAEGNDSLHPLEFIKFLGYSKRSAAEVRAHLYDAFDEGYITQNEFNDLTDLSKKVARMIANLIRYLETCDLKKKRVIPLTKNL